MFEIGYWSTLLLSLKNFCSYYCLFEVKFPNLPGHILECARACGMPHRAPDGFGGLVENRANVLHSRNLSQKRINYGYSLSARQKFGLLCCYSLALRMGVGCTHMQPPFSDSPIPSYPPCSHIYGMLSLSCPCYAHITRLGPAAAAAADVVV